MQRFILDPLWAILSHSGSGRLYQCGSNEYTGLFHSFPTFHTRLDVDDAHFNSSITSFLVRRLVYSLAFSISENFFGIRIVNGNDSIWRRGSTRRFSLFLGGGSGDGRLVFFLSSLHLKVQLFRRTTVIDRKVSRFFAVPFRAVLGRTIADVAIVKSTDSVRH
jgi:hypothetical protein